jgi:hypothetical protein
MGPEFQDRVTTTIHLSVPDPSVFASGDQIQKYTGWSLSRPRDVAELCLAFEVHRRLFEPKPRGCENDRCPPV